MADPLSLTASIIAIGGLVRTVTKGVERIIALKNAPALIINLSNEVAELGILLHIAENAACISTVTGSHVAYHFSQMLERARSVMLELQDFIRLQLLKDPDSFSDETRKLEIRWNVWLLKESKVREMAANMSAARQNIASALTALTAVSTMEIPRMSVSLQSVALVNKELTASVKNLEAGLMERLDNLQLSTPRTPLHDTSAFEDVRQQGHVYEVEDRSLPADSRSQVQSVVQARSTHFTTCSCNCHTPLAIKTPQWLGSTIGTLHVKYSRTASQSCRACSRRSCYLGDEAVFKSRYYFPSWLLHRMVSLQFGWGPLTGHTVSLKTPRSISSKSTVFMLAQHGNIQGMKRLFEQRLASPFDISLEEGRSALHFAVTATQPKMVSFLLTQGADPRLEDHNMLSAHDVVWNYLLQMPGSPELEFLLNSAGLSLSDTDSLEKRDFTTLHRIILGLSTIDLKSYLDTTTSELDVGDSLGKTPLCWAASRPDSTMVETLLAYGASPCIGDRRKQTPLHYSAGSGSPHSTRLILEAALKEAHQKASDWKRYNQSQDDDDEPDFLSEIVDARDSKGRTPLNFATRMNFPEHTRLLISAGANIECVDAVLDRTTLLSAIYWKSHEVISILLESGADADVLDARNASVLHYAARFGDLETLEILEKSGLGQLSIDATDDSGHTAWEIFESRHERCIAEEEEVRERSIKAFRKILENVTIETANPAHVCTEIEDEDSEDPFEEGIAKLKALTATLGKPPVQLSKERRSSTF